MFATIVGKVPACGIEIQKQVHTGETSYDWNQCEKSYSQAANIKRHKQIHTMETPFACNQCDKSFSQAGDLKKHKKDLF